MSITQFVTDRQPHRVSDRDNGYVPLDKTLEWLAERTEFVDPDSGAEKNCLGTWQRPSPTLQSRQRFSINGSIDRQTIAAELQ